MKVVMSFTFDDEERANIARAFHLEYAEPLRKLATRKQLRSYIAMGVSQQDIWLADVMSQHDVDEVP